MMASSEKNNRSKKQLSFYPDEDSDGHSNDSTEQTSSGSHVPKTTESDISVRKKADHLIDDIKQADEDKSSKKNVKSKKEDEDIGSNNFQSSRDKKIQEIRAQIQDIRQQLEHKPEIVTLSEMRQRSQTNINDSQASDNSSKHSTPPKGAKRERETIDMVTNFRKRMKEATRKNLTLDDETKGDKKLDDVDDGLDLVDGDLWLTHKFEAVDEDDEV